MSIQEYTLYKEYEGLSSEQQRFVREALFDVFGRDAMGRRNARAKERDPNFRKRVYREQRLSYEAYDALVHNDYMEQGRGSARGEEMEEDYFAIAEEEGTRSIRDLLVASIQEAIRQHEHHQTDLGVDDIEEMMGEDLTGSELSEEARAEINERSIAIYEDAVRSALEDVQRLFPDIF